MTYEESLIESIKLNALLLCLHNEEMSFFSIFEKYCICNTAIEFYIADEEYELCSMINSFLQKPDMKDIELNIKSYSEEWKKTKKLF